MQALAALAALAISLGIGLGWRQRMAPSVGAAAGAGLLLAVGLVQAGDVPRVVGELWRPLVTITAIMAMTSCAEAVGLLARVALLIEPRTRGPVRRAFLLVYVLAAATATTLSNDAAILVLTPTVLTLLRQVYPRRHGKFEVPFAFAVFYAAGVAPLATANPMNLVVAERAGLSFNGYALTMIPVALVTSVISYLLLARCFREVLADENPALGQAPAARPPIAAAELVVLAALGATLVAYPLVSLVDGPLWLVALTGAVVCVGVTATTRAAARAVAAGIGWELLPFLVAVVVLAGGLGRAGLVELLADLYRGSGGGELATITGASALGSAVLNNHPMAMINLGAVGAAGGGHAEVLAGLVGGDLGPRLLPIGSLAGLLWLQQLRGHGVRVRLRDFVRIGVITTVPALLAAVVVLLLLRA